MATERLQKVLARAGIASRRASEALIEAGRVRVNGRIVRDLGAQADARRDKIEVNGQRIVLEKPAYYLFHKPRGVVTTLKDPEGRPTIADYLKRVPERAYPLGRLDFHTSGVLVITNDGEMAEALTHPRRKVPKVYVAKVAGKFDVPGLSALTQGITLDDGTTTAPASVRVLREEAGHSWLELTIREGKYRQIHRMFEALGRRVMRLVRMSFAGLTAEGLRPGELRPLTTKELDRLKRDYLSPSRQRKQRVAESEMEMEMPEATLPALRMKKTAPRTKGPAPRRPGTKASGIGRGRRARGAAAPEAVETGAPAERRPRTNPAARTRSRQGTADGSGSRTTRAKSSAPDARQARGQRSQAPAAGPRGKPSVAGARKGPTSQRAGTTKPTGAKVGGAKTPGVQSASARRTPTSDRRRK